jgi:hypothetical protein
LKEKEKNKTGQLKNSKSGQFNLLPTRGFRVLDRSEELVIILADQIYFLID